MIEVENKKVTFTKFKFCHLRLGKKIPLTVLTVHTEKATTEGTVLPTQES